jgi:hypothetical protein
MLSYHHQQQQHDCDVLTWMLSQSFVRTTKGQCLLKLAVPETFDGVNIHTSGVKEAHSRVNEATEEEK